MTTRGRRRGWLAFIRSQVGNLWLESLVGGLWCWVLGMLGFFEIQPMALRLACLPVLGLPFTTFFIWETVDEDRQLTFGEYLLVSLLAAPGLAIFAGLVVGIVIYGLVEGVRWIYMAL